MSDVVNGFTITGYKTSHRCQRLAKSSRDNIYAFIETKMGSGSRSIFSENTQAVCVINNDSCTKFFRDGNNFRKLRQVPFHAKDTVNRNNLYRLLRKGRKSPAKIVHVVVRVLDYP